MFYEGLKQSYFTFNLFFNIVLIFMLATVFDLCCKNLLYT